MSTLTTAEPVTTADVSPTDAWLATVPWMPPVTGPTATAERLLLLIHYSINWDGWIQRHRTTYWERLLPERVVASAYRARDLRTWWTILARDLELNPRNRAERRELDALLSADPRPVLNVLREKSEALLVRTRLVAEAVRDTKPARAQETLR